jgi:hypothetical protein
MTDENLTYDDLLNNFDFHFNNFISFSASPEKNMMIGVLLFAVIDYLQDDETEFADAEAWFFSVEDEEWLYSFDNVCFTLGIHKDNFKNGLIQLRTNPDRLEKAKKLKHLYPAPGNRSKISVNPLYQPRNKYDDFN